MCRVTAFVLLLLFVGSTLPAQETKGFAYYDKVTYEAYLQGDWHTVIREGKKALKSGFDTYYLRMRLGIAYYSRKNYQQAAVQFRRALSFSKGDVNALKYLYYSYLYSGREADRHALMHHMPVKLRQELETGRITGITAFDLTFDYFFKSSEEPSAADRQGSPPSDNGYRNIPDGGGSGAFLFTHQAGENVFLNYGYRFLRKNRFLTYQNDEGLYYLEDNTLNQHQLYGGITIRLAEGFTLALSANYLNLRTPLPVRYGYGPSYLATISMGNGTGQLSLRKDFPFISVYGGAGVSNMNGLNQLQTDGGMILYPLGNTNLYAGTTVSWLMQGTFSEDIRREESLIWSPFLGFRIVGTLWSEFFITTGELSNYQYNGGWLLYNEMNPVSVSAGGSLIYVVPKNGMRITLSPSCHQATSYYFLTDDPSQKYDPVKYRMWNFKFGISWNF